MPPPPLTSVNFLRGKSSLGEPIIGTRPGGFPVPVMSRSTSMEPRRELPRRIAGASPYSASASDLIRAIKMLKRDFEASMPGAATRN